MISKINFQEDYYIFKIEEWKQLDRKIEVKGYQVLKVIYTTEFLFNNAGVVTELCIKSKEEYRLWQELKRISSSTETEIEGNINKNSSIEGFSIEGMKIRIKDDKINVEYNGNLYDFNREEFNGKPRGVMQISENPNLVFGYPNLVNSCIRVNFLIKMCIQLGNP